jgi:hypothetical protein
MFWDKHITLRITAMLSRRCLKLEDEDSTSKKKKGPLQREAVI